MDKIYLIIAIISEVIATSALKASDEFKILIPSIVVIVGYLISFYFLSLTLKTMPLGITYALWAGLGIVLTTLVGYFYYEEFLNFYTIIGIFLVLSGCIIINLNI